MSELNSKKKLHFGLKEFAIIYALLAITITIINMFFYQQNGSSIFEYMSKSNIDKKEQIEKDITQNETVNIENTIEEKVEEANISNVNDVEEIKRYKAINLLDKYYINNIEFEEFIIQKGNIIDYDYDGNPLYKLTATYFQITGLKDKTVEENINKKIKEKVEELILDEEINDQDIQRITIYANTANANFNDILSIPINKYVQKQVDNDYETYNEEYITKGMNFRLDNGEELKLEELFTKEASIKNILAQSYYKNLATEYIFDSEEETNWDLDNVDYGDIENKVFNLVSKFNIEENHNFYFTFESVSIIVDNINCFISLNEYPEYVAMYNIVKPEECLYEKGNLPKNNYVLGANYFSNNEYFGKLDDETFLSIYNYYRYDGILEEEYNFSLEVLNPNIDKIKEIVVNDSKREEGKAYIYHIESWVEESDTNKLMFIGEKVEIDKDNFDENVEEIYAMGSRQPTGGEFILSLSNIYNDKEYKGNKIYSFIINDYNDDGEMELGQKLVTPNDWNAYYEAELEY